MGIKVTLKDGTTHKFYDVSQINEIILYGEWRVHVLSNDPKTGKAMQSIILDGMSK